MNIATPLRTATQNAPQVQGRISFVNFVTACSTEASPSNRKSTTAIRPTTSDIAMTWMDSAVGNAQADSRMKIAKSASWMALRNTTTLATVPPFRELSRDLYIGDPAAGKGDGDPQGQRHHRSKLQQHLALRAVVQISGMPADVGLKADHDGYGSNQHRHFEVESRVRVQCPLGFGGDLDDACSHQDDESSPKERHEPIHDLSYRIGRREPEETQLDHRHG